MTDTDERAFGRLEARVASVEAQVERLEKDVRSDIAAMGGKIDNLSTQIVALSTSMARETAAHAHWRQIGTMLLGLSGWAIFVYSILHPTLATLGNGTP